MIIILNFKRSLSFGFWKKGCKLMNFSVIELIKFSQMWTLFQRNSRQIGSFLTTLRKPYKVAQFSLAGRLCETLESQRLYRVYSDKFFGSSFLFQGVNFVTFAYKTKFAHFYFSTPRFSTSFLRTYRLSSITQINLFETSLTYQ